MNPKLAGLLGIARRSGHLTIGFDAVHSAVAAGRARLVLLARDCSPKTEKEIRFATEKTPCPIAILSAEKADLSAVLGLEKPVAVVATDDRGFAAAMQKTCGTDTKEDVVL